MRRIELLLDSRITRHLLNGVNERGESVVNGRFELRKLRRMLR